MKKIPSDNNKKNKTINNQYNQNSNQIQNINNNVIGYDLPTEEEIYKNENNYLNTNVLNSNQENDDYDDTDENIKINIPRNHINPFSRREFNINNNININNFNNNNIFNFNIPNSSNINNINNINSININNPNQINRINSRSQSYLDQEGNIIYRNNSNQIINRNIQELDLIRLDSHRIKVGNNEFEDLTKEAREIQNKEAFDKKILGITKSEPPPVQAKKSFMDKIGDFLSDHEEGIYAFLDGIGCILLHGPSIGRTIDRIDRWIGDSDDNSHQNNNIENVQEDNSLSHQSRKFIFEKNKDFNTIMKFLPIWEIRENKKSNNNNNCVICLYDFQINEKICALPCLHVFHYDCIHNWLKNLLSCPVCKFEVTLSSIIGENNN